MSNVFLYFFFSVNIIKGFVTITQQMTADSLTEQLTNLVNTWHSFGWYPQDAMLLMYLQRIKVVHLKRTTPVNSSRASKAKPKL